MLAAGRPYGEVSLWALGQADIAPGTIRRTKRELTDEEKAKATARAVAAATTATTAAAIIKKRNPPTRSAILSHNAWHIAADWVEVFSPVIFGPVEEVVRSKALKERARLDALIAAGSPLDRPQILLIDDVPVYASDPDNRGKARRDAGFYVLVIAEVAWDPPDPRVPGGPHRERHELRLLRAMAKSNTESWRLCFDELGYTPDFVVADAGTGIAAAVAAHYPPPRTRFVPSLWHAGQAIKEGLLKTPGTHVHGRLREDLWKHLAQLGRRGTAMASVEAHRAWWDELEAILRAAGLQVDGARTRRANYERDFLAVLPDLLANPEIPVGTGGLETLIQRHIQPVLAMREAQLRNIERTNRLLDLVVARSHGAFDNIAETSALLRADAGAHQGWAPPLRRIADPKPPGGVQGYSSLRDATLLTSLAVERGLA